MTRRRRNLLIALSVLLLAAVEAGHQAMRKPVACIEVGNEGPEPIEGLEVRCEDSVAKVARIPPGDSARVYLSGGGKSVLHLKFRQKGNAMAGFDVAGFDLAALERERFKLVIKVRTNEYERYQEEGEPSALSRLAERAQAWLERSLESY